MTPGDIKKNFGFNINAFVIKGRNTKVTLFKRGNFEIEIRYCGRENERNWSLHLFDTTSFAILLSPRPGGILINTDDIIDIKKNWRKNSEYVIAESDLNGFMQFTSPEEVNNYLDEN